MQFEIFKFGSVTSTNDVAINLIREKKKEIGCIYANIQTKGRGTRGREWFSSEGNLFGSIFFPLRENYPPFNEFAIINPVIVSSVIEHYCIKKNISIKWPNDVFVDEKKICGILQELIISNSKKFLIVGIGVNVVSNPKIDAEYQATNIFMETGNKPPIREIINLIISTYKKFFINLNSYSYTDFKKKAEQMVLN